MKIQKFQGDRCRDRVLFWDDRVLDFHKLDRVVRTPSSEQVRRPLNRDGMEVWRPYSEWLEPLRAVLGNSLISAR